MSGREGTCKALSEPAGDQEIAPTERQAATSSVWPAASHLSHRGRLLVGDAPSCHSERGGAAGEMESKNLEVLFAGWRAGAKRDVQILRLRLAARKAPLRMTREATLRLTTNGEQCSPLREARAIRRSPLRRGRRRPLPSGLWPATFPIGEGFWWATRRPVILSGVEPQAKWSRRIWRFYSQVGGQVRSGMYRSFDCALLPARLRSG